MSKKSPATHAVDPWKDFAGLIENKISGLMAEAKVPGVSMALIHSAKIVWRGTFGVSDASTKSQVDHSTLFEAASMSKPVFAYVALKLCEKGVIGLDVPLSKYAPQPFLAGDPRLALITPRHLLSHSSGFQNTRSGDVPLRIHFKPGSEYMYSGEGYYYLQSVITHLNGSVNPRDCAQFEAGMEVCATDFDKFMQANLLKPFGMLSSGYNHTPPLMDLAATPHDSEGKPLPKNKPSGPGVARYGAMGGLLTTPTEYARFMIEVLDPKKPDAYRLSKTTLNEMLRPHVKVVQGPHTSAWGLGWQIQDNGLINHGGDNRGFHCHAIASPKTKSGFVIMTNGDNGPKVIQQLFEEKALGAFLGNQASAS